VDRFAFEPFDGTLAFTFGAGAGTEDENESVARMRRARCKHAHDSAMKLIRRTRLAMKEKRPHQ
jgi:hypothetical protein